MYQDFKLKIISIYYVC